MKERNIVLCIVLSFLTCGIYGIYWFVVLTDDVVRVSGGKQYKTSGGVAFLLNLITCGIYGLYWAYQIGKSLQSAQTDRGMQASDNSILYLVLCFLGLGVVTYAIAQNDLNKLSTNA